MSNTRGNGYHYANTNGYPTGNGNTNGYYPGNGYPGGYPYNGQANGHAHANGQGGGHPNGYGGGYPNGNGQGGGGSSYPNGNGQGGGGGYPGGGHPNGNGQGTTHANTTQPLNLQWTNPALQQVQQMTNDPRFRGDPKGWHERKVTDFVTRHVPEANRVRIRKPAHIGGQDPSEGEHITISCLTNNRPLGSMHVYTY